MSARTIRNYLIRSPRPSAVRVRVGDEVTDVVIGQTPHWGKISESIDALAPDVIEMLDDKGKFIRAVKSDQFDDENTVDDLKLTAKNAASKVVFDAESERYKLWWTHVSDAHKFSIETLRFVETAFNQLAKIVEAATTSNVKKDQFIESMQRAYNKVLMENAELAASSSEEGGDPMELMFKMMMAGAMQGNQERQAVGNAVASAAANVVNKTNGKSINGKARQ